MNWLSRAHAAIRSLHPYVPGKPMETLERELGIKNSVKLASNENPLGCSPRAIAAIQQSMQSLTRYPDAAQWQLKENIAQRLNISSKCITMGNGSDECLRLIAQCFVAPEEEVIFSEYCFIAYRICTAAFCATGISIPVDKQWNTKLAALPQHITDKTRLILLANPNNPTGTYFSHNDLEKLLTAIPSHVLCVIDEAYYEYAKHLDDYPDSQALQKKHDNLIILRTFSKAYGLAGLRLGYCISAPDISDLLNRVRLPFNINQLAQVAANAALDDSDFVTESVTLNLEQRARMQQSIQRLGLSAIDSIANFLTIDFGTEAARIHQALQLEGVIVRPLLNYGMTQHLRVTVGTQEENERFLSTLSKIL